MSLNNKYDLTTFIQVFVLVDLLFIPRLLFAFGLPISIFLVIFSLLYRPVPARSLYISVLLLFLMILSVLYGIVTGYNLLPVESFKRVLQLFSILLYSFIRFDSSKVQPHFIMILRIFYLWVFALMLLFLIYPEFYQRLAYAIYPESLDQLENNINILRFGYIFSDPNSFAYLLCITLVVYIFFEKNSKWSLASFFMVISVILSSQSRGALIAVAFILLNFLSSIKSDLIYKKILFILVFFVTSWILFHTLDNYILQLYSFHESRLLQEDSFGGGRFEKYLYFFENFNVLPIGFGYHLHVNGVEFRPHSDLIRLNLSYGILSVPLFLYFVFPRYKSQLLLFIVFMVPFMINTVIDDYRLFGLYVLFFGVLGSHCRPNLRFSAK